MVTPASEGASAAGGGAVEMQRDTSREDELKRMTQAWETEQPGRLQKVRLPIKPLPQHPTQTYFHSEFRQNLKWK